MLRPHFAAIFAVLIYVTAYGIAPASANFRELVDAVAAGDAARVDALFAQGEDPSLDGFTGRIEATPMMIAAHRGDTAMARRLVRHGMDVDFRDRDGDRALQWAVRRDDETALRVLLAAGAAPTLASDATGEEALIEAIQSGRHHLARRLIDAGATVDGQSYGRQSPLHAAARWGAYSTLAADLIALGADPRAVDPSSGETPLHVAASSLHADTVRLFVDAGTPVDARDDVGRTALFVAASRGLLANVRILLDAGADPDAETAEKLSPLLAAVENLDHGHGDHAAVARLLVPVSSDRDRALAAALRAGNAELSTLLLDHGADPNATDRRGQPALAAAVHVEDIALFDRLVASGADISRFGLDALYEAANVGRADIVRRLLGKGVDPNGRIVELPRPIVAAAAGGHTDVVETLVKAGAYHDRIELVAAMHRRVGLLIAEIEMRRASRAYQPVDGLYAEIDRLSDRHAAIRRLLAADDRR
ncbi:MAG: ankyrin repeat domain-containing protein [Rhizobiaceae bacterium]|nr:ankyrin repeat domain-containing protein [Rhizobiaceae bacterium]